MKQDYKNFFEDLSREADAKHPALYQIDKRLQQICDEGLRLLKKREEENKRQAELKQDREDVVVINSFQSTMVECIQKFNSAKNDPQRQEAIEVYNEMEKLYDEAVVAYNKRHPNVRSHIQPDKPVGMPKP